MKAFLFIDHNVIGEVDLGVIDETMGVLGGHLIPSPLYQNFVKGIQACYERNGIANIHDFNFLVKQEDGTPIFPAGGIGVTHSPEFPEIYVEVCGVSLSFPKK